MDSQKGRGCKVAFRLDWFTRTDTGCFPKLCSCGVDFISLVSSLFYDFFLLSRSCGPNRFISPFFRSERPLIFFLCLVRPLCRFPPSGPLLFILCVLFLLVSSFRSSPFFSACDLACSFSFDANWDFIFSYDILIFRGSSEFSIPLKIGYCLTSQVAQSGLVICFVSSIHSFYEIERYTQLP